MPRRTRRRYVNRSGTATIIGAVALIGGGGALAYVLLKGKGGGGGGGGLHVAIRTSPIAHLASEVVDFSGATPNGVMRVDIITNTQVDIYITPDPSANAQGGGSYSFQVGTNIPSGVNTFMLTDKTTGHIAQAQFTVT